MRAGRTFFIYVGENLVWNEKSLKYNKRVSRSYLIRVLSDFFPKINKICCTIIRQVRVVKYRKFKTEKKLHFLHRKKYLWLFDSFTILLKSILYRLSIYLVNTDFTLLYLLTYILLLEVEKEDWFCELTSSTLSSCH